MGLKRLKLICFSIILTGLSVTARADALTDAQNRRAQAYNDYFKALQSGKITRSDDARNLAKQIIGPASDAVARQVRQNMQSGYRDLVSAEGSPADAARSPASSPASSPVTSVSAPVEALDGSGTPKELEFRPRARARAKTKNTALPSP